MSGCTTKRNKHRDCCKERHRMLFEQGQKTGSFPPHYHILDAWEPDCEELKAYEIAQENTSKVFPRPHTGVAGKT
jgi:hypothetical protein